MAIPKISSLLFRIFGVPSEAQPLINQNLIERCNLSWDKRKNFAFQAGQYRSNWRVLAAWGALVTFTDHPEKLVFVAAIPIWVVLNFVDKFLG